MDDIGSTDDTALLCHTNEPSRRDSEGDWFAPNGVKVSNYTDSMPRDVPGFGRTRSPHVVRLKRSSDGTPPEGMYKCVVRDTTDTNQTVYVGISSFVLLSSSMLTGDSVTPTSSIFKTSEVDVTVTSRTKDESTLSSSHLTQTQTVLYTSSEGTPTPTPTVVYTSRATKTQTGLHSFSEGNATLPVPTSSRGITTLAQTLPTSTQKDSTSSGGEISGN